MITIRFTDERAFQPSIPRWLLLAWVLVNLASLMCAFG